MLLVVIFGVVFTLGYLLGRSQYDSRLRAAVGKPADADPPAAEPAPKSKGKSEDDEAPPPQKLDPIGISITPPNRRRPKTICSRQRRRCRDATSGCAQARRCSREARKAGEVFFSRRMRRSFRREPSCFKSRRSRSEGDALALAQALQQKKFPAFVITPRPRRGQVLSRSSWAVRRYQIRDDRAAGPRSQGFQVHHQALRCFPVEFGRLRLVVGQISDEKGGLNGSMQLDFL